MRVVYEWTQAEWDEALRLATERRRRRGSVSSITYAVILVPLLGGSVAGLINLRHAQTLGIAGTILPMLLGLVALCIVLWIVAMQWRMQRLRAAAEPMPTGECETVLQEGGWRFCTLTATEEVAVAETATTSLRPWSSMTGTREGQRVMVFLHEAGFGAVPMRCLSEDQVGHVQRMMARKLRPQPARK